ncbi:MAG: hypothetical protein KGP29_04630 [Proteobacteria bacterium]|nr:hypothetical protein [Pseudomonadota bacterium]
MQDQIGYDEIIENSMRLVIYEALKKVEKTGLLGNHYFIITFFTHFPEVSISQELLAKYPEEMTIVVQYQFSGLEVNQDSFKISLSFGGKYEKLEVPYKAVSSFADPSMNFALKFSMNYAESVDVDSEDFSESNSANKNTNEKRTNAKIDLSAKVISLDAFRKNKGSNPSDK